MKTIRKTYRIKAPIAKVWQALVDPQEIAGWGGGPAKMDAQPGTKFSLWGGDIWGTNLEVVPENKLVQEWYGGKWDKPSIASFELKAANGSTTIEFVNSDVPDDAADDIDQGWEDYYLGAIKDYLENGR